MGIFDLFRSGGTATVSANAGSLMIWRKYSRYIYYGLLIIYLFAQRVNSATEEVIGGEEKVIGRYQVAKFNFDHVSDVYAITLWILLGSLAKVGEFETKKSIFSTLKIFNF